MIGLEKNSLSLSFDCRYAASVAPECLESAVVGKLQEIPDRYRAESGDSSIALYMKAATLFVFHFDYLALQCLDQWESLTDNNDDPVFLKYYRSFIENAKEPGIRLGSMVTGYDPSNPETNCQGLIDISILHEQLILYVTFDDSDEFSSGCFMRFLGKMTDGRIEPSVNRTLKRENRIRIDFYVY